MTSNPQTIVEVAKALAEPARLAIEKLSSGIGRWYEPVHARRMARASADQAFIEAVGNKDVAFLLEAGESREVYRKIRQEGNLRLIADRASRLFADGVPADAAAPPDEWVDEFTDQSKDASSNELRELWSRLYVAETKQSGAVPRRILRVVRDLDAALARSFTTLLSCCITADDGRMVVIIFDKWIDGVGLVPRNLGELEDVGLVRLPPPFAGSAIGNGMYRFNLGRFIRLTFPEGQSWSASLISLTSAGIAIAAVADRALNERYMQKLLAAAEAAGAKTESRTIK